MSLRAALLVLSVFVAFVERSDAQCQLAKLVASDAGAGDLYGWRVAMHDHRAFVVAYLHDDPNINSGAAFVYEGSGTNWVFERELQPDPGFGRGFGRGFAAGDGYVVGGLVGRASAVVFDDSANEVARLTGHDTNLNDFFGWSVAADGQRIVVGAVNDDGAGPRTGSAYVFERDPNGAWSQKAKLIGSAVLPVDHFGESVAIHGDVVVCGAPESDELGFASGSAYVFERDPNGAWTEVAKLLAGDGRGLDAFGTSVAVRGDVILVGSRNARAGRTSPGAVYVFARDQSGAWIQTQKLVPSNGSNMDQFGYSVAMDGDLALIGARNEDTSDSLLGASYVLRRQADGSWTQLARLQPDDLGGRDEFGRSVALRGNLAVIGAPFHDLVNPDGSVAADAGAAYVFAVGPDLDGDGIMDACICPGDVDGNFTVDVADLVTVLTNFGQIDGDPGDGGGGDDSNPACLTWPTRCLGDLDRDGDVDISDLGILLANWGAVCP